MKCNCYYETLSQLYSSKLKNIKELEIENRVELNPDLKKSLFDLLTKLDAEIESMKELTDKDISSSNKDHQLLDSFDYHIHSKCMSPSPHKQMNQHLDKLNCQQSEDTQSESKKELDSTCMEPCISCKTEKANEDVWLEPIHKLFKSEKNDIKEHCSCGEQFKCKHPHNCSCLKEYKESEFHKTGTQHPNREGAPENIWLPAVLWLLYKEGFLNLDGLFNTLETKDTVKMSEMKAQNKTDIDIQKEKNESSSDDFEFTCNCHCHHK